MRDESIGGFLDGLASSAPAPGGGAAAALEAAMAAALVEMVCNLTIGKPAYAAHEATMREARERAGELRVEALELAARGRGGLRGGDRRLPAAARERGRGRRRGRARSSARSPLAADGSAAHGRARPPSSWRSRSRSSPDANPNVVSDLAAARRRRRARRSRRRSSTSRSTAPRSTTPSCGARWARRSRRSSASRARADDVVDGRARRGSPRDAASTAARSPRRSAPRPPPRPSGSPPAESRPASAAVGRPPTRRPPGTCARSSRPAAEARGRGARGVARRADDARGRAQGARAALGRAGRARHRLLDPVAGRARCSPQAGEHVDPGKDVDGASPVEPGTAGGGLAGLRAGDRPGGDRAPARARHRAGRCSRRSSSAARPSSASRWRCSCWPRDATVTVCHSRTRELAAVTRRADVLVAAAGRPRLIGAGHVAPGAVVVDVGHERDRPGRARRRRRDRGGRGRSQRRSRRCRAGSGPVTTRGAARQRGRGRASLGRLLTQRS